MRQTLQGTNSQFIICRPRRQIGDFYGKEKYLKVSLVLKEQIAIDVIAKKYIKENSCYEELLKNISVDAYNRLIFPSLEREVRNELTDNASEQAIKMFEVNLKPLLMQPPLKNRVILGLDPAYRTGCKIAVIDQFGNVLDTTVVYPTPPQNKIEEAEAKLTTLIEKHNVDVISIGNGTATKESEIFVANMIKKLSRKVEYAVVNEVPNFLLKSSISSSVVILQVSPGTKE